MNKVTADEMRAVPQSRVMSIDFLFDDFDRLIQSPESVHRLRRFILELAVHGKLVSQDPNDEPASELLKRITAEKARLVKAGEIITKAPDPSGKPVEQDFLTPANWTIAKLADISNIVMGQSPQGETYNTYREGVPLINGPVEFSEGPFGKTVINQYTTAPTNFCNKGDFLICVRGSTTGRTNIAGFGACIGRGVAAIQPVFDDDFVRFFLWSMRKRIISMGRGAAFPSITRKQLETLPVPVPPLAEQHRIVAKVDELMALCDRLEAARAEREATRDRLATASLDRLNTPDPDPTTFQHDVAFALNNLTPLTTRPDQIKALRQTILNLAVRGTLVPQDPNDEPTTELAKGAKIKYPGVGAFELPASWTWANVGTVADSRLGKMLDKAKNKGTPRKYLRNVNVRWFDFDLSDLLEMRFEDSELPKFALRFGDVLICEGGEPGRAAVWDARETDIYFQKAIHRVRFMDFVDSHFFVKALRASADDGRLAEYFTGTGIKHFTGKGLAAYLFPLPPLAEQQRIVAKVDKLMFLCDQLEANLATGDDTCCSLFNALLHETVPADGVEGNWLADSELSG